MVFTSYLLIIKSVGVSRKIGCLYIDIVEFVNERISRHNFFVFSPFVYSIFLLLTVNYRGRGSALVKS